VTTALAHAFLFLFFFLLVPRPPRSTLFPYTTLFRSPPDCGPHACEEFAMLRIPLGTVPLGTTPRYCDGLSRRSFLQVGVAGMGRSEEHTSELQSLRHLVCRLLLEKKKKTNNHMPLHR